MLSRISMYFSLYECSSDAICAVGQMNVDIGTRRVTHAACWENPVSI
jgi:hypothetical protein